MRNMPAPKKYLDKGLSPLHACCLFLLDQVKDKFHICGVDNLYTSARSFAMELLGNLDEGFQSVLFKKNQRENQIKTR